MVTYETHKCDTQKQVFFYEQDFYILSNFSAFAVNFNGIKFPTAEHAYHAQKFIDPNKGLGNEEIVWQIQSATSAHEAFKIGQAFVNKRRPDWDEVKVDIMRRILKAKVEQHEYVKRKLLATGDRELIEDSWRDDFWGWGPNKNGQNMLGKLWMELRTEIHVGDFAIASPQVAKVLRDA